MLNKNPIGGCLIHYLSKQHVPVIIDTGCTRSVTPFRNDFDTVIDTSNDQEMVSLIDWDLEDLRSRGSTLEVFITNNNIIPENDFDLSLLSKLWEVENLDFLGPKIPQKILKEIASGKLDPITKQPYEEEKQPE